MELELYPRYQGHCLRTQMAMTVVGKLVGTNPKRCSILLETSHDCKGSQMQPRCRWRCW